MDFSVLLIVEKGTRFLSCLAIPAAALILFLVGILKFAVSVFEITQTKHT